MSGLARSVRGDNASTEIRRAEPRPDHPYRAELEAERAGWYELAGLVRLLTAEECLVPGYYRDPDWTVRDLVAHLGPWLAEAEIQLERLNAGTYEGHEVDVDMLNAAFREAMRDQPWNVAWTQANAGRTRMVQEWYALRERTDEAVWWVQKSGPEHYAEHLGRLRGWVDELIRRRDTATGPTEPSPDNQAALPKPESAR